MEALAAKQLKKQKFEAAVATKTPAGPPEKDPLDIARERLELNRALGFPDPPAQVFALGKEECAAVWWSAANDETVIGWEVHRFRKDRSRPGADHWQHKGFVTFTDLLKNQVVINELCNEFEYRFTVKALNTKGTSMESEPSNPVMVEKPLPTGWHRFHDHKSKRHYYANVRLGVSSWSRPETDPWFLDEAILMNFDQREIEGLKKLYKEEIAHFQCVTVDQFMDVLREVGERCTKGWIVQLFRGYAGSDRELHSWTHFMEVVNHIKKYRISGGLVAQNPLQRLVGFFRSKRVAALLQPKAEKLGDWVVEYSDLAERNFYRNTRTGERCWSTPAQVKFYIPPRLEDKLLMAFDYGEIERFQHYFALLDVDNSGDLSGREVRLLLRALDIKISEPKFQKLLRTVDLNGNGTIEFDEFCWMMLEIFKKDNTGAWKDVRARNKALLEAAYPRSASASAAAAAAAQRPDDSQGQMSGPLSEESLENSLFGDRAWGGKLSYSRLRGALDGLGYVLQSSDRGGDRRFSVSSGTDSSFRGLSRLWARKNSLTDASTVAHSDNAVQDSRKASMFNRLLCCCYCRHQHVRNHTSKLNTILSNFDEAAAGGTMLPGAVPAQSTSTSTNSNNAPGTYYPPARLKAEAGGTGTGRAASLGDGFSVASGRVAATAGTTKGRKASTDNRPPVPNADEGAVPPAPAHTTSPPKSGRRVSFNGDRQSVVGRAAVGGGASGVEGRSVLNRQSVPQVAGEDSHAAAQTLTGEDADARKHRRARYRRRSSSDGAATGPGAAGAEYYEQEEEEDRSVRSHSTVRSILRRVVMFAGLAAVEGDDHSDSSGAHKPHPKYCMCGCRAY